MKNQIGKVLFLMIAFHLVALISCDSFGDDLNCGNFEHQFYEVLDIHLINFEIDDSTIPRTNTQLEDSALVKTRNFRLVFQLDVEYFTDNSFHFSNPFITTALACTPPLPEATEIITDIIITSSNDLIDGDGNSLPSGTSLTNFFFQQNNPSSLMELVERGDFEPLEIEFLELKAFPTETFQPHQFSISYELDSTKVLTATSPTVFLD